MPHFAVTPDSPLADAVPDLAVLDALEASTALSDPDRRRLVAELREQPDSATGLARRLGDSRQRLNHHLRTLEAAGVVELHEERRKGNCTERVLRVAARRFLVDPTGLDDLPVDPAEVGDRFSASHLIALAARAIRETAALVRRACTGGKRLATLSLDTRVELASPAALQAFADDLAEAVADVVQRHHAPSARSRPFRLLAAAYPAPDTALTHRDPAIQEDA
jgi:DNA-binding transcriptional ArsR family regulator